MTTASPSELIPLESIRVTDLALPRGPITDRQAKRYLAEMGIVPQLQRLPGKMHAVIHVTPEERDRIVAAFRARHVKALAEGAAA